MDIGSLRRAPSREALRLTPVLIAVGATAFLVRLHVLRHSGLLSVGSYDDGVYYSAAAALLHGRLPYRDLLLLQPPGVVLALTPFAALAGLVGDARAFGGARIAWCLLGAVVAVVVVLLLRRLGPAAAATGGAVAALLFPAVYASRTITQEPLGQAAVLLALLALERASRTGRRRWWAAAGVLAGLAVGVKLWFVVPLLLLLLVARRGRLLFAGGGAVAVLAVYLPFFVLAPVRMWQQVVTAQLGRAPSSNGVRVRLGTMLGVSSPGGVHSPLVHLPGRTVTLVLAASVVLAALVALVDARSRVLVALLTVDVVLVLSSPSFFQHYAALTSAPIALVVGAAVGVLLRGVQPAAPKVALVTVLIGAVALLNAGSVRQRYDLRPPIAALRQVVQRVPGCIVADDPTVLVVLNRLTPELARGCPLQADPSGAGYVLAIESGAQQRYDDPAFQREIVAYLHSGSAYFWTRGNGLQLDEGSEALLREDRVIGGHGRWTLRASPTG